MAHSQVRPYRLEDMHVQKSIYQRQDGKYIVEKGQNYHEIQSPYSNNQKYPQKSYSKYPKMHKEKVTVTTYNKADQKWWQKIFSCCRPDQQIIPDFQDCDYCQRRVYKNEEDSEDQVPYVSQQRMKHRQSQPIHIFCDKLDNNTLIKNSWQSP